MPIDVPRLAIITPSFNQGQYIEETIDSILSQGYPNLEYIIVDGGSSDNSVEIIRKYSKHLSWWVSERDNGQSHAINKGFARANAAWYSFLNSDDLLEPGALQLVAEAAIKGARWIAGPVRFFGEGVEHADGQAAVYEADPLDWFRFNLIPQPGCFWSADLYRQIGGLREDLRYVFDYEYWLRIRFKAGERPTILGQNLAAFRYHPQSKTASESIQFDPELVSIRADYRRFLSTGRRTKAWLYDQRFQSHRRQVCSLTEIAQGHRTEAIHHLAMSLMLWPPCVLTRQTGGVIRRLLKWPPNRVPA